MTQNVPSQIRVSIGTAAALNLQQTKMDAAPTTAYLMTYHPGKCVANCGFCPQARESSGKTELLSRVTWPTFPTELVTQKIAQAHQQGTIGRVCIQALNYSSVFIDLQEIIKEIRRQSSVPISVSCQPLNRQNMQMLKQAGANRLGIALDAATEQIFNQQKGACYSWNRQLELLSEALAVFGAGNVSTHIIVGLGETEHDAVSAVQRCVDIGVLPALFAFTPVRGTKMENHPPPSLDAYRRVQLARHLIVNGYAKEQDIAFDLEGKIVDFGASQNTVENVLSSGVAFQTSGCPDCNRPYYNEKPSGPIYNYPKKPSKEEIEEIKSSLN